MPKCIILLFYEELIRKKGLEKVTIDELVDELILKGENTWKMTIFLIIYLVGRATVPNKIKEDLLARIKSYFEEEGF